MLHSDNASRFGFRIVGSCHNERRLIDWLAAFAGYSQCDERAEVNREAYLSEFCFGVAFRKHLDATGSTKGYAGECWSPWLWFDIDRDDLDAARLDCLKLVDLLLERYDLDALQRLSVARLRELAQKPRPFELPNRPKQNQQAVDDWLVATELVESQRAETRKRDNVTRSALNRQTLDFIREGAANGDRHRLLFSAAANLAEFGCSFELAYALLSEAALDSGLPPQEVRRQIDCGLKHHSITDGRLPTV